MSVAATAPSELVDIFQRFQEGIDKAKKHPEDVTPEDYARLKSLHIRIQEAVEKWQRTLELISARTSPESDLGKCISLVEGILDDIHFHCFPHDTLEYFERSSHDQALSLGYKIGKEFDKQGFLVCYFGEDLGTSWLKDLITIAETGSPIHATGHRPLMHFRMPGIGAQFAPTSKDFLEQNSRFQDTQNGYREALHSSDILISNKDPVESAPCYFLMNSTYLEPSWLAGILSKDIVQHYLPCHPALKEKMQRIIQHAWIGFKKTLPTNSAGRFYVIAIPQCIYLDPEKNFVYRSHRFGIPCKLAQACVGEELAGLLKPDVEGNVPSCDCDFGYNPQARLIEPGWALHRKNIVVYAFDSMNIHERAAYEKAVNQVGMAIHHLSRYRNAQFFAKLSLFKRLNQAVLPVE